MKRDASKAGRWLRLTGVALVMLAAVLALLASQGSSVAGTTFNPQADVSLSSYDSDDNANITTEFEVTPPDVNFDAVVSFTPSQCEGGLPGFYVATDDDVPNGTEVGSLSTTATLSTVLTTCSHELAVNFTLFDATTDVNNDFADTGDINGGTWNGFDDVGGLERAIVQYPGFLKDLFPGITPRARYYGHTFVYYGFNIDVTIMFMVFEPGDCPSGYNCPVDWGYPSVTVLNNPTVPAAPSALGDFCTPLTTDSLTFGLADSIPLRTNPPYESTCIFHSWSRGLPDADGDGYENDFDTCPFDVNVDADPRDPVDGRGPDADAIDSVCDPTPGVNTNAGDHDLDAFANNADNCPLIWNNDQEDTDGDGIGDECDTEGNGPGTMDGVRPTKTIEMEVEISGPEPPTEETPTPTATVVAVDTDGDTVTDDVEELYGSDPEDANSTPEDLAYDAATCSDGVDNDGDGLIDDDDSGCAVVEETPTPTPTGEAEYCSPVFPGTYNGLVRIDGQPAASGYQVTASIDSVQWGSAIVSGGRYALDIPDSLPTVAPCFEGGTITFALDGMTCTPTADWASGIHNVDLACAPAAPAVTPTPEVTPTPTTPTIPPVTPTALPPSGAGGLSGSSSGLPLWAMALASWAGLMTVAGLGTLVAAKRR